MKLKKGDKVMVIAGKAKGQSGAISQVFTKTD
jgi:ribosomal protein L24